MKLMLRAKTLIKKIILSCLIFILLAFSFVPYVHAQEGGTWYNQSFKEWYTKVYDSSNPSEIFGERYTAAQVQWILFSLAANAILLPKDLGNCVFGGEITSDSCRNLIKEFVNFENLSQVTGSIQDEAGGLSLIFKERPVSGIHYLAGVAYRWRLIPEAKAQGFGYTALNPVLGLWRATRNIAYALAVIATVILAFMVMFRVKISPQTVITVQSALPKIAIALVLITFSYAIAGFMVDLVYVLIGLLSLVVSNSKVLIFSQPEAFKILTEGYFGLGGLGLLVMYGVGFSLVLLATIFGLTSQAGIIGLPITGAISPLIFLFIIILAFTFLFAAIKFLWVLIRTYVNILLLIIFAPFQISLGVISTSAGFGAWLRNLAGNLAVYPVAGALFMVALVFLKGAFVLARPEIAELLGSSQEAFSQGVWNPPLTLGTSFAGGGLLWLIASLVVILIIPKTADLIKSVIEGKPFAFGTAIGEAFGPAGTIGRAGGLYGIGKAVEYGEGKSFAEGTSPPVWSQVLRRFTGLRK